MSVAFSLLVSLNDPIGSFFHISVWKNDPIGAVFSTTVGKNDPIQSFFPTVVGKNKHYYHRLIYFIVIHFLKLITVIVIFRFQLTVQIIFTLKVYLNASEFQGKGISLIFTCIEINITNAIFIYIILSYQFPKPVK